MKELTDEQLDILADVDRSAWCKFQANEYHTGSWNRDEAKHRIRAIYAASFPYAVAEAQTVVAAQRCERGTVWDAACVACVEAVARLTAKPDPAVEALKNSSWSSTKGEAFMLSDVAIGAILDAVRRADGAK